MTAVDLIELTKIYNDGAEPAAKNISLQIESGQITALLGPSGGGKTTILKMIAGLIPPTAGDIHFDGESVLSIPAEKRSAVMVFQNYLLFPHMNITQNVGFGLRMRGVPRKEIDKRVAEMLDLVQLPDVGSRRPSQLSGGQQQRVALARALVTEPRALLLDEPLSNLDAYLRDEMRDLILGVQRKTRITTILVTHDQEEAVIMADKIALLLNGELQQYAAPQTFYRRPHSEAIARFFGGVNFVAGSYCDGVIKTAIGAFAGHSEQQQLDHAQLFIRPEQIVINPTDDANSVTALVKHCEFMGTYMRYELALGETVLEAVNSRALPGDINSGEQVQIQLPPEHVWVLPA